MQKEGKKIVEPEKKSDEAATKVQDDEKEGDTVSQQEEHRKGRRKRVRISEVEKLQIGAGSQLSPTKLRAAAVEQKKPRTKFALHKVPKGNVRSSKDVEVVEGRRKQEEGPVKNVNILTKH